MRYSEKQKELLRMFKRRQLKRLNLLHGSVRSGKTWISLVLWGFWLLTMPKDKNYLMAAKTLTSLKRNCLDLMVELFGSNFTYSLATKEAELFGRKIHLEGANDARAESKIRGMTLAGAYCDELTLFAEDFFVMLLSRLSEPGAKLFCTTNPDNPMHWLKANYINRADELDMLIMTFLLDDNPYLDAEYVANLKREFTGVFYKRYVLGLWVPAEGLIYGLFADSPERYAIKRDELPKFQYINIGVDFGGNKSAYAFVATGLTEDYDVVALRSQRIPAKGVSVEQMMKKFIAFAEGIEADYGEIDYVYPDNAEQAIINSMIQNTKYSIIGSVKGEIIDRIRTMDILLSTGSFKYVDGECDTLVTALQTAMWDEKKLQDARLDNGTSDIDTLDAFEYSWSAFIRYILRGVRACFSE